MFGRKEVVRYAVVGGGQIAQQAFMPGISRTNNSRLSALVTGDPVKAKQLAEKYEIKAWTYDQYETLLSSGDIDAVYIVTPNALHTPYVLAALEAGIHVLLEKPATGSVAEAEEIVAVQQRTGTKLMIAYRLHHEPATVDMVTRAQRGDFGDLRAFTAIFAQNVSEENSRGHNGFWGGPVPDMGTYPLNAVRNLFGQEPTSVHAVGVKTQGRRFNFHDTVAVTLQFAGERIAQFTVSYATASAERFTLIGTKATIEASPCFMFGPEVGITYMGGRQKEQESTNSNLLSSSETRPNISQIASSTTCSRRQMPRKGISTCGCWLRLKSLSKLVNPWLWSPDSAANGSN